MAEASSEAPAGRLVVRDVGPMLTGRIEAPLAEADCLVADGGRITAIEREADVDTEGADVVVDAHGAALCPGLIGGRVHPVAGDWTPRRSQLSWIGSSLHGGVTTTISAGEVHTPGRPEDPVGVKALAIAAQRMFAALRPSGVRVIGRAPVIEHGPEEEDFAEMAAAGVTTLGEIGLGSVKDGETAGRMEEWARRHGMRSTIHTGGPAGSGSGLIDEDVVLEAGADVIGRVDGGHTALPDDQIRCLCGECRHGIELVHDGDERAAPLAMRTAFELGEAERVMPGTDGPAGSGVQPLGIPRMVAVPSSLGDGPAEVAFCFATGDTARIRELDRGTLEVGHAAEMVVMDRARHAPGRDLLASVHQGNLPGVGMTNIDRVVRTARSRNTPPAERLSEVVSS